MSRPYINLKRLNKAYRQITGQMSMKGVKLVQKCDAVIEHHGQTIPSQKAEKVALARALLSNSKRGAKQQPPSATVSKPVLPIAKQDAGRNFYRSWEWKQARYEAIRRCGQRCMCCGWKPGDTEGGWLVVDHIKPRRKYPELALVVENLQVLCNDCNMGKSHHFEDDWREIHRATIQ